MRQDQLSVRRTAMPPQDRLFAALDRLMGADYWRRVQLAETPSAAETDESTPEMSKAGD